ncbi:hypothetical protein MK489_05790 [Myxococcota bacterium]|nr:hypothetical protein [Myxococcota bacterium]
MCGSVALFLGFRREHGAAAVLAIGAFLVWSVSLESQAVDVVEASKISFSSNRDGGGDVFVMDADGSNPTNLTIDFAPESEDPTWSSDGTRIAFETNGDLFVMNADGSGRTNLTGSTGEEYSIDSRGAWSPDGTKLVAETYPNSEIHVIDTDGSGQLKLTNGSPYNYDSDPEWSPAGNQIAFGRCSFTFPFGCDIYVMSPDGTGLINLTNGEFGNSGSPAWSSDGSRIVFSFNNTSSWPFVSSGIVVMNADGSDPRALTTTYYGSSASVNDLDPAWSPDGSTIVFERCVDENFEDTCEIYVVEADSDGGDEQKLTDTTGSNENPAWSPDGTQIGFRSERDGNREVYVMAANGSGQTNLTNNVAADEFGGWMPLELPPSITAPLPGSTLSGSFVTFDWYANSAEVEQWWLYAGSSAGASDYYDTGNLFGETSATVTNLPINGSIVYVRLFYRPGSSGDWEWVDLEFTAATRVDPGAWKIAFSSDREGGEDVFVMEADGSSPTNLTPGFTPEANAPRWSLDGIRIAFESYTNLYVMNVDGSERVQLTDNLGGWYSIDSNRVWSPDGTKIVAESSPDCEIYVIEANGGGQVALTDVGPFVCDYEPEWSPDGSRIAFSRCDDSEPPYGCDIHVMNSNGTHSRNLTQGALGRSGSPSWSPDGAEIALHFQDAPSLPTPNTGIAVIDADGSDPRILASIEYEGSEIRFDQWPAWSPDGSRLVFERCAVVSSQKDCDIYGVLSDGSEDEDQLTDTDGSNEDPTWSPDGAWIAFRSERDGNREVYVMAPDGSSQTNLTNNAAEDKFGSWSPGPQPPMIVSPFPGSTLFDSTASFQWAANDAEVGEWRLALGSALGASDYYDSGPLSGQTTAGVADLPIDGSTLYLRLQYRPGTSGDWEHLDTQFTATTVDSDLDGVSDDLDNCTLIFNETQLDTDADGCGNACDADYDQNGVVGASDFAQFRSAFQAGTSGNPGFRTDVDADGDDVVGASDFAAFRAQFQLAVPGPSLRADRDLEACP